MNSGLKKNYVYATIVNINEDIPNAIVLSHSIKKNGSMYKIIVKNSNKLNNFILMNYFDMIIYNEKDFEDYDKVLLIDINSLIYKNLDYLFNIHNISNIEINNNIIKYDEKPFLYKSSFSMDDRIKNENNILWFNYYREIINNNFDLLNNELLKDANDILKFYTFDISLNIRNKNIKNNNKYSNLNLLFNTKIIDNFEYYHTNISKEYNDTSINFYTDNISLIDFITFIDNTLKTNYMIKKYKNIKEFIDNCDNKKIILDLYLKYSPSILIILINNNDELFNDDIKKNIIYSEDIVLNNYDLKNILFNINQEYVYDERIIYLNNTYKDDNYKIKIICFEIKDFIIFKDSENIIICENIDKKIRASGLLLKKYKNKYDFIKKYKNINDLLVLQSLKKWIYNNFNGEEISNIIIFIKNNKFIILDNNKYENIFLKIKELNKIKLFFMELIFLYSSSYKNIIKKNKIYDEYDINNCFEIDGLKFLIIH
jgi:hypothetical protein